MKYAERIFRPMPLLLGAMVLAASLSLLPAQEEKAPYLPPADPLVRQNLDQWQDLKFGLFMHWGTYSQWGIVESWSLCPEDEGWTRRKGPAAANYFEYKQAYENLQTTFQPVDFQPERWAKAAREAGFRYMIFTFKHHDGFCMFDTRQTDYRITSPKTPFHRDPRANIAREICDAFRAQGFLIGAYFSKPDWHSPDYWWPYFPPKDRHVNYDPARYPERWQNFKDFTYRQIEEITTGYGKMDILWLDGGWVRPHPDNNNKEASARSKSSASYNQDIDMPRIAAMARSHQPGLIVVDRAVGSEYENYRTPEQRIPAEPLDYPWETCMTMARSWSYVPDDVYKPARTLVHNLVEIVVKGGNYLLNVGPSPRGDYHSEAYTRLQEIGAWLKVNSEAIYSTRPLAPYKEGNLGYTRCKDGRVNLIYLAAEGETALPAQIAFRGVRPAPGAAITLLGRPAALSWQRAGEETRIDIPPEMRPNPPAAWAWAFQISAIEK